MLTRKESVLIIRVQHYDTLHKNFFCVSDIASYSIQVCARFYIEIPRVLMFFNLFHRNEVEILKYFACENTTVKYEYIIRDVLLFKFMKLF